MFKNIDKINVDKIKLGAIHNFEKKYLDRGPKNRTLKV